MQKWPTNSHIPVETFAMIESSLFWMEKSACMFLGLTKNKLNLCLVVGIKVWISATFSKYLEIIKKI